MWEVTFWASGVRIGEAFCSYTLDDNLKFLEGVLWGLSNVARVGEVEMRVVYKTT